MGVIRKTHSLELLLAEFQKDSNAISAKELISRLSSKINKTTVYRILDKLEDDGVVHSFLGKNGIKWYAKCIGCSKSGHLDVHPHFQCLECGKVDCLDVSVQIPELSGRKVITSQILVQGTCEVCNNV